MTKTHSFGMAVRAARDQFGGDTGRITDYLLRTLYPRTQKAATDEGCTGSLRNGVYNAVRQALKGSQKHVDERQIVHPVLQKYIDNLSVRALYVPDATGRGTYRDVSELVCAPDALRDLKAARDFLRQKADETSQEARKVGDLLRASCRHYKVRLEDLEGAHEPAE